MNKPQLLVDGYLNHGGNVTVLLRREWHTPPQFVLSREEAERLRDELTAALTANYSDDAEVQP